MPDIVHPRRRHGISWRLTALVLVAGACSSASRRGGGEAGMFPPVDAQRRLVGGDTLFSVSGNGYQLVSPEAALLSPAKFVLDGAAREYRRYFGDDPPAVVVELDTLPAGTRPNDSTPSTAPTIRIPVPRAVPATEGKKRGTPPRAAPNVAPIVARVWLSARVDKRVRPAAATAPSPGDAMAPARFGEHGDDPRIPDWIEDAMLALMTRGAQEDLVGGMLARQSSLIPLDSLFRIHRPPMSTEALARARSAGAERPPGRGMGGGGGSGGYGGGGMRRGGGGGYGGDMGGRSRPNSRLEPAILFETQSRGVALFLSDREGPELIGHVFDALSSGASVPSALSRARMLPTDVEGLERAWRIWLSSFAQTGRR